MFILLAPGWPPCWGQSPAVSQQVGVVSPILDEWGLLLKGTDPASGNYGIPAVEGDLVEILQATDNNIYPPNSQGEPDPRNVILSTTRIGLGGSPLLAKSGKFGAAVSPRPGGNSRIFVRVFNAASRDEASFYGDSQLFVVKGFKNELFLAIFSAADHPLDVQDADGDGLINSWEKSMGSDPMVADSDGDGVPDGEERIAGTRLLDSASFPMFSSIKSMGAGETLLEWPSVSGRKYAVDYFSNLVSQLPLLPPVANVVATSEVTSVKLVDGLTGGSGSYRLRVTE